MIFFAQLVRAKKGPQEERKWSQEEMLLEAAQTGAKRILENLVAFLYWSTRGLLVGGIRNP